MANAVLAAVWAAVWAAVLDDKGIATCMRGLQRAEAARKQVGKGCESCS